MFVVSSKDGSTIGEFDSGLSPFQEAKERGVNPASAESPKGLEASDRGNVEGLLKQNQRLQQLLVLAQAATAWQDQRIACLEKELELVRKTLAEAEIFLEEPAVEVAEVSDEELKRNQLAKLHQEWLLIEQRRIVLDKEIKTLKAAPGR